MSSQHANAPYYFVPGPSKWPVLGGTSLLLTMLGASAWVNGVTWGAYLNFAGIFLTLVVLYNWFGDAIAESEGGKYSARIDVSFRWSMSWFIFSEVMFFGAFFGALFYARSISMPWLADLDHKVLWPDFAAHWGNTGPAGTIEAFKTMTPFPIPTINTALLLTSGVTLTLSHHALRAGHRTQTAIWLFATILLGAVFMGCQAYEYIEAYHDLNLKLTSGIYGSTFFLLTGFHGFHVTMGAIMLSVVLYRVLKGHFTPEQHFAFEGAAWYWHFVDVVWLGLYVVVYWL
ncbi:cytochrome c oxidase subunit 3 [Undibacterium sp. RTI2.1]|uniref:cytochrome c oxidase subunit 3 n=1 Tax=unclassified Undibacterium TaxID=2630295 RepID=UPI002AB5661C|nr:MULTISPECIES: cytochrome c oxidase subunit 3 [unclassified Undibacterium]MDY7540090.1 cytochrome c oxidase subunit 3 [Undibacterium sp. 5I1]MEB0031719.1 cytochrome c oxidase subunit 3 [Undibacterium sp. RTI2.1]MEB0118029.1 cytochrome c oxidase subunit 3 [Undibacterium sp. RTI2.2]MEB0231799.1 cytochrome c oxidase subunit 3 [Undibacterium sp. 10I3]MEB0259192.1 cytochrome c oxidase subunit 3 [Undibacterium sp. 5I1]